MKYKRAIALGLCFTMLAGNLVGVGTINASEKVTNGNKISYLSPAITANVGENIDLTQYGVEFSEGTLTSDGLTWSKESDSITLGYNQNTINAKIGETLDLSKWSVEFADDVKTDASNIKWTTVPKADTVYFAKPAILADVGDNIDLSKYSVEFTDGVTTKASDITWSVKTDKKLISFEKPAILCDVGETITLANYNVEFTDGVATSYSDISWKDAEDKALTQIIPSAKGVTVLTATAGEATKKIYVVAKNAADTEYVLYENDFNEAEDKNDFTAATNMQANGKSSVSDGYLTVSPNGNNSFEQHLIAPEWIGQFGDYTVETSAKITTYKDTSRYVALLLRANGTSLPAHYAIVKQNSTAGLNYRTSAGWGTETGKSTGITTSNLFTLTATYKGDTVTQYVNGSKTGTVSGLSQYKTGTVGLMVNSATASFDYFKVTLEADEETANATVTSYTPAVKGVTELTATAGDKTKSIYVVAKNEDDTEYVLYENDFNEAADINDFIAATNIQANGKRSVSGGYLTVGPDKNAWYEHHLIAPTWIGQFGDYTVETRAKITAQQNSTCHIALLLRANDVSLPAHYALVRASGSAELNYKKENGDWIKTTAYATKITASELFTLTATYKGDTATQYVNGIQTQKVSGVSQYKVGTVGLMANSVTASFDYFKVTLDNSLPEPEKLNSFTSLEAGVYELTATANGESKTVSINVNEDTSDYENSVEYEAITSFTPATKGVTKLIVKSGETEKNVYVVAKDAADTEYVLYDNGFDSAADLNGISVVEGNAELAVENGSMTVSGVNSYVRLPKWLGEFGDYKMQMTATTTSYGSDAEWIKLFARAQNDNNARNSYNVMMRHKASNWDTVIYNYRDASATEHRMEWASYHAEIPKNSPTNYTLTMKGDLFEAKQNDTILFHNTEAKELRTGYLGFAVANVGLSVDSIKVTLETSEKPAAPVSASFTSNDGLPVGTIAGKLHVNLPTGGEPITEVSYYWGNGTEKLEGYASFANILVSNGATNITAAIPEGTLIPAGATELRVYTVNHAGESDSCVTIPLPYNVSAMEAGEEQISFQLVSDPHIASDNSYQDSANDRNFKAFLDRIANVDPNSSGVLINGDIVDNGKQEEFNNFVSLWQAYSSDLKMYANIGNHELWNSDYDTIMSRFYSATGTNTPYYTAKIGGYDFAFLGTIQKESESTHNIATLGTEQLTWLENILKDANSNKPVFVLHHQKLDQIAERDELKAILAQYPNAIFITAHTHTDLNTSGIFELENNSMCKTLNTSGLSYTVDSLYNPNGEKSYAHSQGYYVEVYTDKVIFKGMDMLTGEWLPSANFVFHYGEVETYPTDAKLYAVSGENCETFEFDAASLKTYDGDSYAFTAADTAIVDALNSKFHFYYEREGNYYGQRDLFTNPDASDKAEDRWVLSGDNFLQRYTSKTGGEIFRKIDSLIPLDSNGNEISLKNFETTYDIKFDNANDGAVILGFRQSTPGKFVNTYYNLNKEQGFVAIGQKGITVAAGSDILKDMYDAWKTETFSTALPAKVSVKVRTVNDSCEVYIYEYGTQKVLHQYKFNVPYLANGSIAYAVSEVTQSIGNIKLTALSTNGTPINIKQSKQGELDYANGKIIINSMENTESGYKYTVKVTPNEDYALRAGSFYVTDNNGNVIVPECKEKANLIYTFTVNGEGFVNAEFLIPGVKGDIDRNGRIEDADRVLLAKYLIGESVECDEAALDTNGDGSINICDLVRIKKELAK